jgi:hypothetical protein
MGEGSYKASKGLIRVKATTKGSEIREITIAGDFFMYPEDLLWELEKTLKGSPSSKEKVLAKIEAFYSSTGVLTPGVTPQDFTEAIMRAISAS